MNILKIIIPAFAACSLLGACRSDYQQIVERELASGVTNDSIVFGFFLGMKADSFYNRCWQLNKTKLFKQGIYNTSVEYEMTELKHPALMNFYPTFHEGEVREMPFVFQYKAWAPWNKELWSDSLLPDVVHYFEKMHGGRDFIKLGHPQKGFRYAKVDGNRRILVWKANDMEVNALYTDLRKEKALTAKKSAGKESILQ
jgi:hypothetical protein